MLLNNLNLLLSFKPCKITNLNSTGCLCVNVFVFLSYTDSLKIVKPQYVCVCLWMWTFCGTRKGKESKFALYCISLEDIFYICGQVILRNWDYFNENTFINSAFFPPSLVERKFSHFPSWIELPAFGVMLIEWRNSNSSGKLGFKYWLWLLCWYHVKFRRLGITWLTKVREVIPFFTSMGMLIITSWCYPKDQWGNWNRNCSRFKE